MKTLKVALLGTTFLIGAAAGASAADVYQPEPVGSYKDAPAPYYPAITWTGFYVGGHLGGVFGSQFDGDDVENGDVDNAFTWGGHVGYNWQTPSNWVFGIEGDLSGVADEGEDVDNVTDYLASVRARLGVARGATLFYATAGVAFIGYDEALADSLAFEDDSSVGYVVGGGIEHKLRNNFSLGLEGLYYNFENEGLDGFDDVDHDFFTVRARLNYHFASPHQEPLEPQYK